LFTPEAQEAIAEGANVMLAIAHKLLAQQKERGVVQALSALRGEEPEDDDQA
jgi:ribosomal protein S25